MAENERIRQARGALWHLTTGLAELELAANLLQELSATATQSTLARFRFEAQLAYLEEALPVIRSARDYLTEIMPAEEPKEAK